MAETIRVLLAEGTNVWRGGIQALLAAQDDLELVGTVGCAAEALRLCQELAPQLLLLDVELPGPPVWELVSQLRRTCPGAHAIVLAQAEDDVAVLRGLVAGAAAHVLKGGSGEALLTVLRAVAQGRAVHGHRPVAWVETGDPALVLTGRELQVVALAAQGLTDCASGARLGISERGVRSGLQRARRKLGLGTRAELIAWAGRHGLA